MVDLQNIFILQNWTFVPLDSHLPFSPPLSPWPPPFHSRFLQDGISCKWEHTAFVFLCVAYFAKHNVLQVPACCHRWHDFLLFFFGGWVAWHCMHTTPSSYTEMLAVLHRERGRWCLPLNRGKSVTVVDVMLHNLQGHVIKGQMAFSWPFLLKHVPWDPWVDI